MYSSMYFADKLALPFIRVGKCKSALATCNSNGKESVIQFDLATIRSRPIQDLQDILLHEAVHQSLAELHTDKFDPHCGGWHHSRFAEVANNIARQRGWPDCSEKTLTGPKAAAYWPPRTHY